MKHARKWLLKFVVVIYAFLSQTSANAAEITANYVNDERMYTTIGMKGMIERNDVNKIRSILDRSVAKPGLPFEVSVYLNSNGGDVEAAMQIGRLLRERLSTIAVDHRCASACVLILVAGSSRFAAGYNRVGIHRPYSTNLPVTGTNSARESYRTISTGLAQYLREMGMPGDLYDAMMRVPPEDVRWLSRTELEHFGIVGTDPSYDDMVDSMSARSRGISKAEWLRRKRLAAKICEQPQPSADGSYSLDQLFGDSMNCELRVYNTGQ